MSKKSYKQQQNRLYREIKKRIIAEKELDLERHAKNRFPLNASWKRTERVRARRSIYVYALEHMDEEKLSMARELGEFLMRNGYIDYETSAECDRDGYVRGGAGIGVHQRSKGGR